MDRLPVAGSTYKCLWSDRHSSRIVARNYPVARCAADPGQSVAYPSLFAGRAVPPCGHVRPYTQHMDTQRVNRKRNKHSRAHLPNRF
jgi:hypothetical protein